MSATTPASRPTTRLAVVNRGEPAMRLINAVREWNAEAVDDAGGTPLLRTIAVYTASDRHAMFVREADEAVLIGPPDEESAFSATPYLDLAELERALTACAADMVWPGWGFVSERADFVALCERLGVVFVGPSSEVMGKLGDKIESKRIADTAGVPMAPWSGGPVADVEAARAQADKIGYPLMVKATAGGGGRGIRLVQSADALDDAFESASREGERTAGDATVFLEGAIRGGRHVEVQVLADAAGTVWTLGVRDCSVQRRNQKVLEESSSTALDAEQDQRLRRAAADLARAAGYVNAGTVEFLYDPREQVLTFMEVNTRLQVEHPVTEVTTGIDIVKLQLRIALGGTLDDDGSSIIESGHAIEARLTAEDPERGFAPAPGRIQHLVLPTGPGIRVDTGVAVGDVIPPQFDSMIAKVIAWGRTREEARSRLSRAIRQTAVVIEGGTTNKAFLLDLLARDAFVRGEIDTSWLDGMMAEGYTPPRRLDVALLAAAVEAHDAHVFRQQGRLFLSAERGRPEVGHEIRHQVDVRAVGESYRLHVARTRPARYHVEIEGADVAAVDVDVERSGRFERRLRVGGQTFGVLSVVQGSDYLVEVDGAVHRIAGGEAGLVRAPAPAMVVSVPVSPGDTVSEGDTVAVVESMKLETALRAPVSGRVAEILVDANTQVEGGTRLVRLEPDPESGEDDAAPSSDDRVDFSALVATATGRADARTRAMEAVASLRALVLGFDLDDDDAKPLLAELDEARDEVGQDPDVLSAEIDLLQCVADLSALSRNRRLADTARAEDASAVDAESARNPQEYFHAYLRSRDADAEVLPESFRIKLRRALAHYGVSGLDAEDGLGPALYRMFLAHRRAGAHVPVVDGLLARHRRHPVTLQDAPTPGRDQYRDVLDRLVAATQVRNPAIGELARQVRFRCFDAPLISRDRRDAQARVVEELDRLSDDPATRREQIDGIVASGSPILGVFSERHHAVMLEVMTRRYYGLIRPLSEVEVTEHGGRPQLTAGYSHDGHDFLVVATTAAGDDDHAPASTDRASVSTDLHAVVDRVPAGRTVLIDLYVASDTPAESRTGEDADERAERIRARVGSVPSAVARVTVGVRRRTTDDLGHGTEWFTFRAAEDGSGEVVEDRTLRGLHPMVAERLGIWRLADFDLTRLAAPGDVHLFHAQGRHVPEDQRLIAMGDVRDLTTVRDDDGKIRSLPQLEQVLDTCLDSLRSARTSDPALGKLAWNRVLLYIWPVVDVPLEDFDDVISILAPRTEGLGLEQVMVRFRASFGDAPPQELVLRMSRPPGAGLTVRVTEPPTHPMGELDSYTQKVIKAQRRGALYPYELIELITRSPDEDGTPGTFTEYDLDENGRPVPVDREPGSNTANFVLGIVSTPTARHPEGLTRVVLLGDPTRALGAIAEPECRRVLAALSLARDHSLPVEWYAVSAGAKIAMDSGTENMDWISRVLRGIIRFTQDGGEINVVVTGINVGAQPYWNAEATMLMHTRGILVMTPDSAMVLTGKQSLDYSGGVSAEDNYGIGGYDRIMGPNGEAQYWAADLSGAVDVLLAHYAHTYVVPGERFPRAVATTDPDERDVRDAPHSGPDTTFTRLGEIFDRSVNGERKKPFDIRSLMVGVADADHDPLERWADMQAAESVVVLDAHLGGQPVEMVGIESRPLPRRGPPPVDGPSQWTAGTLFPRSSKKAARAINAASGNRPVVVLANLSGFDGSPESLRGLQLEYGAEIGRAVVNFDGPIVFCVVSRYHGGAFVVFSATLNDNMEIAAVEGSYASVIGGAPAAAVVFAGDVNKRTAADPRVAELEARIAEARGEGQDTSDLRSRLDTIRPVVRAEKLGEVADEFDAQHSIARAQQMGSVHEIVDPARLRAYLIDAVRRGVDRTLSGEVTPDPYVLD